MPAAIAAFATRTGQPVPATRGEFTRAILESLALRYRTLIRQLRDWMPDLPDTLHVVGGGSQNALLNQMTADATGLRVMAGPIEATAAGNILAQLMATGAISSLEEGRTLLRASFAPRVFEPQPSDGWEEKAARLASLPK
jgi:rhamnulokinase